MDYLSQQFVAAKKRFFSEIAAIRRGIESIREQQQRQHEADQAQRNLHPEPERPLNIQAEVHDEPAQAGEQRSRQRLAIGVQAGTMVATILAFLAASYYACIAKRQWETMNKTYWEIQKQTTAAQEAARSASRSVELTRQALAATQAAICRGQPQGGLIQIGTREAPDKWQLRDGTYAITNSGKGIALDLRGVLELVLVELRSNRQIGHARRIEFTHAQLEPPQESPPNPGVQPVPTDTPKINVFPIPFRFEGFSQRDVDKIAGGQWGVLMKVSFEFDNGYGRKIPNPECWEYLRRFYIRGFGNMEWHPCASVSGILQRNEEILGNSKQPSSK